MLTFFALSGYVLARPYYTQPESYFEILSKRLAGRYLRLNIPIAAVLLLSYACYRLNLYHNLAVAPLTGSQTWLPGFGPASDSLLPIGKQGLYLALLTGQSILPPLWSLRVEFLGSLYLLLFYLLKPKGSTLLLGFTFYCGALPPACGAAISRSGLGKLAFSIYLVHGIALCSLSSFLYLYWDSSALLLTANLLRYGVATLLLAAAFEKHLDRNAIRIAKRFAARVIPSRKA